ncbi:MAG TPA: hypothetical protein VGN43_15965 [Steroidobacteraceae bacterium]|jgi:hypothetical protein|nr:hypothetical protein [Steroidobacteraceae bacterium]
MSLAIQFIGAIAVLVPFILMLFGRVGRQDRVYLWLNLSGGLVLTADAWLEQQWGFVLLQAAWAAVAAWGLIKRMTGVGVGS